MSEGLQDLLERIREHPAFDELFTIVEVPGAKPFRPSLDPDAQTAEWIFRSGRALQQQLWRDFLTSYQENESERRKPASRG